MSFSFARNAAALLTAPMLAFAAPAAAEPRVTDFELDNGLRAVVIEDARAPVVTHMVWYRVGGADEPPGKSGIAHYLEHLMFKGTDEIPPDAFSKLIAAQGGQDNAFTSQDYTAYFQRIASDRLDMVMRMEADRMTDLAFTEEQALTELDVVLEERALRTDTSPGGLFAEQRGAALHLNHPYGDPLVGWRHEMEGLTREDALAFYAEHYAPENAFLIVAGDVTPEEVRRLAETHYGPIPRGGRVPERARPAEPPHTAARRVVYEDARVRQPYITREWLAPSRRTSQTEAAALAALGGVLGDGVSSVLTRELVTERALAVSAGASYSGSGRDYGRFIVYATPRPGVSLQELEAALDEVIDAFLAGDGPEAERLDRFKAQWRAAYIYAQDSQVSLAQRYGAGLASDLTLEQIEAWPEALQAVTLDDVMTAGRALMRPEAALTGWLRAPAEEGGEG